jgi:hypothetical protein
MGEDWSCDLRPTLQSQPSHNHPCDPPEEDVIQAVTTITHHPCPRFFRPSPEDVIQAPSPTLQSQPSHTICVTLRRRSQAPPSPCDPEMFSQVFPTFGSDTTCKSGAAESSPALYTHEVAPHQTLGPPEPTTIRP